MRSASIETVIIIIALVIVLITSTSTFLALLVVILPDRNLDALRSKTSAEFCSLNDTREFLGAEHLEWATPARSQMRRTTPKIGGGRRILGGDCWHEVEEGEAEAEVAFSAYTEIGKDEPQSWHTIRIAESRGAGHQ